MTPTEDVAHTTEPTTPTEDVTHTSEPTAPTDDVTHTSEPTAPTDDLTHTPGPMPPTEDVAHTTEPTTPTDDLTHTPGPMTPTEDVAHTTEPTTPTEDVTHTSEPTAPTDDVTHTSEPTAPTDDLTHTPGPMAPTEDVAHTTEPTTPTDDVTHTPGPMTPTEDVTHTTEPTPPTEDVAHTPEPTTQTEDVAHTPEPTTQTEDVAHTTEPTTPAEDVTHTPWPMTPTEDVTHTPWPMTPTEDVTHTTEPTTQTEDVAHTPEPTTQTEDVAHTPEPTTQTEDVAHTTEPTTPAEDVTHTPWPMTPTEDVTHTPWPMTPTEDVTHTPWPMTPAEDVTHTPWPMTPAEDVTHTPWPMTPTEDVTHTTERTTPTEDVAHTPEPTTPTEDVAHTTEPTTPAEDVTHTSEPTTPAEDVTHTPWPMTPTEDVTHTTEPTTPAEDVTHTPWPMTPTEDITCTQKPTAPAEDVTAEYIWDVTVPNFKQTCHSEFQDSDCLSVLQDSDCLSELQDSDKDYVPSHINISESDVSMSDSEDFVPDSYDEGEMSDVYMNLGNMASTESGSDNNFGIQVVTSSPTSASKQKAMESNKEGCIIIEFESDATKVPLLESQLKEEEKLYDTLYPEMYIKKFTKNIDSKHGRPYDRRHACYICGKLKTNIQTHLEHSHRTAEEVKKCMEIKTEIEKISDATDKKAKKAELHNLQTFIRNKGNNIHNTKVCEQKKGEILLARRTCIFDSSKNGPCPRCEEWIILDNIMKHETSCSGKEVSLKGPICPPRPIEDMNKGSKIVQSKVMKGQITTRPSKKLKKEVFSSMKRDDLTECAQTDDLIVALGEVWLMENVGNRIRRKNFTSFRMRLAARLLLLIREQLHLKDASMSSVLVPKNFDTFVECTLKACDENSENELQNPSTAIKLGYGLSRLSSLKLGFSIKESNELCKQEATDFLRLLQLEWGVKVTKLARVTLEERHFNKESTLPHPDDIVQLASYLVKQLESLDLSTPDEATFREAVLLTQTRLLLYNSRRPGELESLRIETYLKRASLDEADLSLRRSLTEFEKSLLESQDLVEIRGKTGRGLPVIIPEETKRVLEFLSNSSCRDKCSIQAENLFMFANKSTGVVRAGDALNEIKERLGSKLKHPKRLLATNFRKHTATIAQVLSLGDNELKWLCNHLGHTMRIHEQYYRQTSGLIERIDIAKLMIMKEHNLVGKFSGKKLSEIQLDDLVEYEKPSKETEQIDDILPEDIINDDDGEINRRKTPKSVKRIRWTKKEEEEITSYFEKYFSGEIEKTCPSKYHCKAAITKSKEAKGDLHKRDWETLKKKYQTC
ncbi:uncharacterized protein LOC117340214 [Pecten maximus]|uniref:uncharacterized protein LOC117340214 n=1 Tax=Pecten maximus TaxID=6579 RepID=UPI001458ABA4|nr:uncharacterized protein LOC117340214 [Pecten maximus]